jgi:ABC-2 type transport system permease protein
VKSTASTSGLERNLRAIIARTYVRVVGSGREPSWILWDTILPMLTLSAYIYVYDVMSAPREFTGFVIVGGAMIAFWLNVLWNMAAQLYWEKETGNLEPFLIAPISRMAMLMGMAIGGILNTMLRALGILVVGIIVFKVEFTVSDPFAALLVFVLTLAALYSLGMVFASVFLMYGREAWHTSHLLQEPIYFLSGFYFPVKYLPFWLQVAASIIPVTFGLDAIRQVLILGAGLSEVSFHVAVLAAFWLVLLLVAKWALRYMEDHARSEGRLTLRWQ